jgi:hypothetical protein
MTPEHLVSSLMGFPYMTLCHLVVVSSLHKPGAEGIVLSSKPQVPSGLYSFFVPFYNLPWIIIFLLRYSLSLFVILFAHPWQSDSPHAEDCQTSIIEALSLSRFHVSISSCILNVTSRPSLSSSSNLLLLLYFSSLGVASYSTQLP